MVRRSGFKGVPAAIEALFFNVTASDEMLLRAIEETPATAAFAKRLRRFLLMYSPSILIIMQMNLSAIPTFYIGAIAEGEITNSP